LILALVFLLTLIPGGCSKSSGVTSPAATPRSITGTLTTGKVIEAAVTQVSSGGGAVSVTDTSSPLNGLKLEVPANSYKEEVQFIISYAPIEKHNFGKNFNPVTPLIKIENGGNYSTDLMTVTIPVNIPEGNFAMGFYYDENNNTLEGMPLIDAGKNYVTIATRHFSSFTISSIADTMLTGDVDTGFKPGVDDWQISNWGSVIVGSQCVGQSISSIWYYQQQPDGGSTHLFNRYDNDGNTVFKTPDFEYDDSLAIKLTTSLQLDYEENNLASERKLRETSRIDDEATLKLFRYSMLVTRFPQLLVIASGMGGHALVAYKISNNAIYVADPNIPGDTSITYQYDTTTRKFGTGRTVFYAAVSAMVDW